MLSPLPTLCLVVLAFAPAALADVALTQAGQARAAIYVEPEVMADDAPQWEQLPFLAREAESQRQRLRESVKDLALYLGKMSGARIETITAPRVPRGAAAAAPADDRVPILIGRRGADVFGPPKTSVPFKQGYRVVVSHAAVALIGESDLATSYAIYDVLDALGCRWFMPSEFGESVPRRADVRLNEGDASTGPATWYRSVWFGGDDFKRRNRMGGWYVQHSHALDSYITPAQREANPDWRAVVNGKPHDTVVKWTHPAVADAMADTVLKSFDKGAYGWSASLSPEDGIGWDESEDPRADAGDFDPVCNTVSKTDRLMVLCNRVAGRVAAKRPEALLGVIAYVDYTRAPVREPVHPNVVPIMAPITYTRNHPIADPGEPNNAALRELFEGWGRKSKMLGVYFYGHNLAEMAAPYPMIARWSADIPFAIKHNVRFVVSETTPNYETAMHGLYLGNRLAWDPAQDPAAIVRDINARFYGAAGGAMGEYWAFIDRAWVETPEYSGAAFYYQRRFTPEVMKRARALMDAGLKACTNDTERARVTLADESLRQFEAYMKMRQDVLAGRFAALDAEAARYIEREHALADRYRPQFCFTARQYGREPIKGSDNGVDYFNSFHRATYDDAARIARAARVLPGLLRTWRFRADKDGKGEAAGWARADFDDTSGDWKSIDAAMDSWSALGLHNYWGAAWYRTGVELPAAAAGEKTYLWIGSTDGRVKVFVNGRHVPFTDRDGKTLDAFEGFCQPASFDITAAAKPGAANQITVLATRTAINEVGVGGLLTPPAIYFQKP